MSNDKELHEAAEIVLRDDAEFDGGTTRLAAIRVAEWAVSELSRRDAEAAERQRRIEAAVYEIRDAIDVFPGDEEKIRDIITRHLEETT